LFELIKDIFSIDIRGDYTKAIEKLEDLEELTNSYLGVSGNPPILLVTIIVYYYSYWYYYLRNDITFFLPH